MCIDAQNFKFRTSKLWVTGSIPVGQTINGTGTDLGLARECPIFGLVTAQWKVNSPRPPGPQAAFCQTHPDFYEHTRGTARLHIREGRLHIASLDASGQASTAVLDFYVKPVP